MDNYGRNGGSFTQEISRMELAMEKNKILAGFEDALHELKLYREGKLELRSLDELLKELE